MDIRRLDILGPIMTDRLDLARNKSCDGVEPDNIDVYSQVNSGGFKITYQDQLAYNTWLAQEAHIRGLSIGLKNDVDQVRDLVSHFDWAINEQCWEYNECNTLQPFIAGNFLLLYICCALVYLTLQQTRQSSIVNIRLKISVQKLYKAS